MPLFVIGGTSLSPQSTENGDNIERLLDEKPFFVSEKISVGPFELAVNGQVNTNTLEDLLAHFAIARKNKKYFDTPSIALFHCVAPLRKLFAAHQGQDIALYVNLGPANAALSEFTLWAEENPAEGTDIFTKMMASSVVKILPNVVMSNLSMNANILGENTVTAGTAASSAWCIQAAAQALNKGNSKCAIVASASFPYQYFNMDAFHRFFGPSFFEPTLCEGAAAIALTKETTDRDASLGAIVDIRTFKAPIDDMPADVLAKEGYDLTAYEHVLLQPSPSGNFLAASEPLGLLAVLKALEEGREGEFGSASGRGLSVTHDNFGNYSAIEVFSSTKALSSSD